MLVLNSATEWAVFNEKSICNVPPIHPANLGPHPIKKPRADSESASKISSGISGRPEIPESPDFVG